MILTKKWKKYRFTFDIITNYRNIGIGIDIGNNSRYFGKYNNIYLEIHALFWSFGFELEWDIERKF